MTLNYVNENCGGTAQVESCLGTYNATENSDSSLSNVNRLWVGHLAVSRSLSELTLHSRRAGLAILQRGGISPSSTAERSTLHRLEDIHGCDSRAGLPLDVPFWQVHL